MTVNASKYAFYLGDSKDIDISLRQLTLKLLKGTLALARNSLPRIIDRDKPLCHGRSRSSKSRNFAVAVQDRVPMFQRSYNCEKVV